MSAAIIHKVTLHRLAIPMRVSVRHAPAERTISDSVIVEVEFSNGVRGFGETLARPKKSLTGENGDSVATSIEHVFVPLLLEFHPESFPDALEFIEALPWNDAHGKPISAARAAVELALLDAAMRCFQRSVDDIVRWMGIPGFGQPGCIRTARYGGVLATDGSKSMMRQLRRMYWRGLRDFKLTVGTDGDVERVRAAARYLARPLRRGRATLRVDAGGQWDAEGAAQWLSIMNDVAISAVEQPLPRGQEELLAELRGGSDALIVHDESLMTEEDARRLIELGVADAFNICISKCGGFLPSLRLAALARRSGVTLQLGCTVGETSVLSAAGLRFLEVCPDVRWAEGCFGTFFLRGDVVRRPLRFGYGGRPPRLATAGWGIEVEDSLLAQWGLQPPKTMNL